MVTYDPYDLLNALESAPFANKSELVSSAAIWAIDRVQELHGTDRAMAISDIRQVLRERGMDIADSEGDGLGCDLCKDLDENDLSRGQIDTDHPDMHAWLGISSINGNRMAWVHVRERRGDEYSVGFGIPVSFCPKCGRRIA